MRKTKNHSFNIKEYKPAIVTIGDEILLGEQENANQTWMSTSIAEVGFPAELALSLPDQIQVIGHWIDRLRSLEYYPVFISGGIGGTHDDCTREGIAVGLNVTLSQHQECHQILSDKYGPNFSQQRQRMTLLPEGCALISNPIGAPGFYLNGVYAFPGFPSMLKPMFKSVITSIFQGKSINSMLSKEVVLPLTESKVAVEIENFINEYPDCKVGIYPSDKNFGKELTIRMRTSNPSKEIAKAFDQLIKNLSDKCK